MRPPRDLPSGLDDAFTVEQALLRGAGTRRLRAGDLERPFHGVRSRKSAGTSGAPDEADAHALLRAQSYERARMYAPRLRPGQFFSHETAALLWGAPIPLAATDQLHVGAIRPTRAPRCAGVHGHELGADVRPTTTVDGLPVTDPATTWALLGRLSVPDLVALGDHFVRVWRTGWFRRGAGTPPLSDREELRGALERTRRSGARRLRAALERIREDSWSPMESKLRCVLYDAGLPEPDLNIDVFSDRGAFLGCVDLAYPALKVAIEYNGTLHSANYAHDVDRIETLRAHGWTVIEVTWPLLFRRPEELVARVRFALRERGCPTV